MITTPTRQRAVIAALSFWGPKTQDFEGSIASAESWIILRQCQTPLATLARS